MADDSKSQKHQNVRTRRVSRDLPFIHSIIQCLLSIYYEPRDRCGTGTGAGVQKGKLPACGERVHARKLLPESRFFACFNKTILPLLKNEHTFFPSTHSQIVLCVLTFLKTCSCLTDTDGENTCFSVYGRVFQFLMCFTSGKIKSYNLLDSCLLVNFRMKS